jgi:hypothetical protein
MHELTSGSVGLAWIGGWLGGNRSATLKHRLMLGVISAMLGALLQGCTADKKPSQEETGLANAAKDVTIPLEAGKMTNPLPETCFSALAPNATVRMRTETRTSGATCTRLPWT